MLLQESWGRNGNEAATASRIKFLMGKKFT